MLKEETMNTPEFKIKVEKCPYCGSEHIGMTNYFSGPTTYNNNKANIFRGVVICADCKRQWPYNIVLDIKETN